MHFAQLAPLLSAGIVRFVSLEQSPPAAEAQDAFPGCELADFSARLHDFADTAALVAQLDLVISVDAPVAQLAGALGKPSWTLLRPAADWRWGTLGGDSAWYPSIRLFRHDCGGDWNLMLDEVAQSLKDTVPVSYANLAA
jgi:ADP-heptose:LPS heptosyltransferase